MNKTFLPFVCLGLLAAAAACGDELEPDGATGPAPVEGESRIAHLRDENGVRETRVDARDATSWVYLDLETGKEVAAEDAWDLAFQRMAVISNGGVSGTAGAAVAVVRDATFDAVGAAPRNGYVEDAADTADDDDYADSAFGGAEPWYAYDLETHTLGPQPWVFVVRTADGNHFKLAFTGYYDAAGTSGYPTFRWSAVEPGETPVTRRVEHLGESAGVMTTRVDARDASSFVYLDLDTAAEATAVDAGWDLAFQRMTVISNGGASGDGGAAVAVLDGATFDEVTEAPADGYVEDAADHASAFGGEDPWYDYDPVSHTLAPKARIYVVRTGAGAFFKVEIASYYGEDDASGFLTLRWAPLAN